MKRAKELPPHLQRELKSLETVRDDQIDTSDIPEITDEEWRKRKRYIGLFYRPMKRTVTIRLDADVLDWFKKQGRGYQTKMNRILREYFASHR